MAGVTETEFTVRVPNNTDNKARNLASQLQKLLNQNCNIFMKKNCSLRQLTAVDTDLFNPDPEVEYNIHSSYFMYNVQDCFICRALRFHCV
jgi:hypothetical protein